MKCTFSEQPYQWQDESHFHVGQLVTTEDPAQDADDEPLLITKIGVEWLSQVNQRDRVLVCQLHTNVLEFVEWGKLSPYPASPIPEPENTGKVEG